MKFVVLQDRARDIILGIDFSGEFGVIIDLGVNRLTLRKPVPPPEELNATLSTVQVIINHVNVSPQSIVFLPVGTKDAAHGNVLLEGSVQLLLGSGVGIVRDVMKLKDECVTVLVFNFRQEPQHFTEGAAMGHIERLRDSAAITALSEDPSSSQQHNAVPGA